jgi:hypothetical protein
MEKKDEQNTMFNRVLKQISKQKILEGYSKALHGYIIRAFNYPEKVASLVEYNPENEEDFEEIKIFIKLPKSWNEQLCDIDFNKNLRIEVVVLLSETTEFDHPYYSIDSHCKEKEWYVVVSLWNESKKQ